MYKFRIHLADDQEQIAEQVKFALYRDEEKCTELIDFKWFHTVGEAIAHYEANPDEYPDVALCDINFTDRTIKDADERGEERGLVLIEYLLEKSPKTKTFAFTAYADDEIGERLGRLNLLGITIPKGKIGNLTQQYVFAEIQKAARRVIKNLSKNHRNDMASEQQVTDLLTVGEDGKLPVVPGAGFTLPCLLAGWGDIRNMKKTEVQDILGQILREETTATEFRGVWAKPDSPERIALERYKNLNRVDYERELKAINRMAFDLLLEFIGISESGDLGEKETGLSLKFNQQNFSVTSKVDSSKYAFMHKLVARRAIAAFTHYYGGDGLTLNDCAVLLRDLRIPLKDELFFDKNGDPLPARKFEDGKPLKDKDGKYIVRKDKDGNPLPLTEYEKKDMVAQRTSSVINTALGLASAGGRNILIDEAHLLREETIFLKLVGNNLEGGTYAVDFSNFLAGIISKERSLRLYFSKEEVQNMSDLKCFFDNVKANKPEEEKELLARFFKSEYLINVPENKRRAIFHLFDIPV